MSRNAVGFCVVVCLMLVGCGSQETSGVKVAEGKQLPVEPVKAAAKAQRLENGFMDQVLEAEKAVVSPREKFTNSIGIEFANIPAGKFLMGTPATEKERSQDETQHEVTLTQGFRMGIHEVTQAQYEQVMGKNPSENKGATLPVETVSYDDALEFCQKLSDLPAEKAAGRKYRLPTEAEWEYCCRAGTSTPFHFGNELNGTQANCDGTFPYGTTKQGPYLKKTSPVGSYPANDRGLHDMHGNVLEWCQDWYGDYPKDLIKDPKGSSNGERRVLRGGSWSFGAGDCRAGRRYRFAPVSLDRSCGFRLLLPL